MPAKFHNRQAVNLCLLLTLAGAGLAHADVPARPERPGAAINPQAAVQMFTQKIESGGLTGQALADAYFGRCRAKIALKDTHGADEDCSQSITVFDNVPARTYRGGMYNVQKNYPAALQDFAAIARLQPANPLGHALSAVVYWEEKNLEQFASESDAAMALEANPLDSLKRRAELYFNNGYWARAQADYESILLREPDNADILHFRGDTKVYANDLDGGIRDYDRALQLDPKQAPAVAMSKALAFFDRQRYDNAMQQARIAADDEPNNAYRLLWLQIISAHAGKSDGQDFLKRSAAIDHTNWPWAVIAYRLGQTSENEVWAAAGAGKDLAGQKCEAQFYVGESVLAQDRDRALSLFRQVAGTCLKGFVEYNGAVFELRALGENTPF